MYHLENLQPHIVMLQETWLDASVESVNVPGYTIISRRDRSKTENRGGVMTLCRSDFNALAHVRNCLEEERSWHFLNIGAETFLVGNWYRPGATVHDGFEKLQNDFNDFAGDVTGVIIAGDVNVHHQRWLRYSNANTPIGSDLKIVCDDFNLMQLVREPTRGAYLLDLFLTDVAGCHVSVGASIADHKAILAKIPIPEFEERRII